MTYVPWPGNKVNLTNSYARIFLCRYGTRFENFWRENAELRQNEQ